MVALTLHLFLIFRIHKILWCFVITYHNLLKNQGQIKKNTKKSALEAGWQVSIILFEKYITKLQKKKEKAAELINIRKDPIQ